LIEAELFPGFFQLVDQRRGCEELRADAFTAGGESQGD
jgi:hypothetical protein